MIAKYRHNRNLLLLFASMTLALSLAPGGQPRAAAPEHAVTAHSSGETSPQVVGDKEKWYSIEIRHGERLTGVLKKLGVGVQQAKKILSLGGEASALSRLHPGDKLKIKMGANGRIQELLYDVDPARTLQIKGIGRGNGLVANTIAYPLERRIARAFGTVEGSLLQAGKKAGLPDALVSTLTDIFASKNEPAAGPREGGTFTVLYEEFYARGKKVRDGAILAAELINDNKALRAIRYIDGKGHSSYYTPEGESLRQAFLNAPVEFARVTSEFSLARRHPILNRVRSHNGIDYAAPIGTPVMAAGDGEVAFVGNKSGYGRTVILKHGAEYTTLYAHLSRHAGDLREGDAVKQGQVIGYVGRSGLATAPHLHYEFRVNDVYRNPLTFKVANTGAIDEKHKSDFARLAQDLLGQLDSLRNAVTAVR
ncbi:MAG: peptidoglycan DD-metalloendopeptidase family protein [Gammaproteobacteria bacterium]|nr:peptidoglycan DD-metalloendopeptidase family protein [Gammaproteobacteria bacterium]